MSCQAGTVSSLGILVTGITGSGTECTDSGSRDRVTENLGTVLAYKSAKFIDLGTLRDRNVVLVGELLQLGLAPCIDDLVGESGVSSVGAGRGRRGLVLSSQVSETGVSADRGDELVTRSWLRSRDAVGVEPLLQV